MVNEGSLVVTAVEYVDFRRCFHVEYVHASGAGIGSAFIAGSGLFCTQHIVCFITGDVFACEDTCFKACDPRGVIVSGDHGNDGVIPGDNWSQGQLPFVVLEGVISLAAVDQVLQLLVENVVCADLEGDFVFGSVVADELLVIC